MSGRICCDFFAFFYTKVFNWVSVQEFVRVMFPTVRTSNTLVYALLRQQTNLLGYTQDQLPSFHDYESHDAIATNDVTEDMLLQSLLNITERGFAMTGHEVLLKSDCRPIIRQNQMAFRQQQAHLLANYNHQEHLNRFRLFNNQEEIITEVPTHVAGILNNSMTDPSL